MNRPNNSSNGIFHSPKNRWLLLTALALILVMLVNLLISLLPSGIVRVDMTASKLTDLTDFTKEYVASLDEEITLHYVCVTGNEDEAVRTMVDRYDELSEKLSVNEVDPVVHPNFVAGYTDRELSDNSIIVESQKRRKVLDYNDFMVYTVYVTENGSEYTPIGEMIYADFSTFYSTYEDYFLYGTYTYEVEFAGEGTVTSAIDYVIGDVLPKVYSVTGHGETALTSALLGYLSLDNIDHAELALPTAEAIPSDADCLILNAPQTDLKAHEADLLRAYLLGGGNVILLTDSAQSELSVLNGLMNEFGMEAQAGILRENDTSRYYSYPYFLLPNTAGAQDLYDLTAYTLLMPYAHPIAMTECEYTMTYTSLFQTSSHTVLESLEGDEAEADDPDDENDGSVGAEQDEASYDVGALVKLQTDEGSGKLCWLGSAMMLGSDYNSAVSGGNYTYFLAILESMCDKTSSIAIDSKSMTESALVLSNGQSSFWAVVIIGLIPLAVLTVGIVIRGRRRRK